jgi:hypothetical protein
MPDPLEMVLVGSLSPETANRFYIRLDRAFPSRPLFLILSPLQRPSRKK